MYRPSRKNGYKEIVGYSSDSTNVPISQIQFTNFQVKMKLRLQISEDNLMKACFVLYYLLTSIFVTSLSSHYSAQKGKVIHGGRGLCCEKLESIR
jgi:hypothetical protein